jgi:hypothetical protein
VRAASANCSGTLTVCTPKGACGSQKAAVARVLGTRRFSIRPGTAGKVKIKLDRRTRRSLAKRKSVRALIVITVRQGDGRRKTVRERVTISPPPRKRPA